MHRATFRFYAELLDFLPPEKKAGVFEYDFNGTPAVKDAIEAMGVPHTEVDVILVNGESVDFHYLLQAGDRVSVYPIFEALDVTPLVRLRPKPLRITRFVADTHLGRLARYLRMLGFDTHYRQDLEDDELARISVEEKRILLTRDRGLLKRSMLSHGYCLRSTQPSEQLLEVVQRFDLFSQIQPFSRCMECNGEIRSVEKEEIVDQIPPRVRDEYEEYSQCHDCRRVYWKGSHYDHMQAYIQNLLTHGDLSS